MAIINVTNSVFSDIDPDTNHEFFINNGDGRPNPCNYFTLCQYENISKQITNSISLLCYNIRSFNSNGPLFQAMAESFNTNFDIIVLSETWCTPLNVGLCNLEGYRGFHVFRDGTRSGGISVFVKEFYRASELTNLNFCNQTIESSAVFVKMELLTL